MVDHKVMGITSSVPYVTDGFGEDVENVLYAIVFLLQMADACSFLLYGVSLARCHAIIAKRHNNKKILLDIYAVCPDTKSHTKVQKNPRRIIFHQDCRCI